jgi:hypothetical protein
MLRSFFTKKLLPLTGAPAVRRLKSYSAQSGFVYQYFYEGQRPFRGGGESGAEFVFSVSAGGKSSHPVSVLVTASAQRAWEQSHARTLSSAEQYAVAKMALFQAFDERAGPPQMKEDVLVRSADVEAIIETLGL